ncbi:MAG: DUF5684 domain-containing protein [Odoribacter sp.]|nr:DUF5684 domain-containing protein [Odoribacter sp.]
MTFAVAFFVVFIIGVWKTLEKAGQPGWGGLIPIYNLYLLTQVAQKPGWWVIMFFIPIANIVFSILLYNEIAKRFGQGVGFTIGLFFFLQYFSCC